MWFFWSNGQIVSYWLFLDRIVSSFRGSSYEITNCTKLTISILLVLYQLIWMASSFFPFVFYIPQIAVARGEEYAIEFYLVIPSTTIDLIITATLT